MLSCYALKFFAQTLTPRTPGCKILNLDARQLYSVVAENWKPYSTVINPKLSEVGNVNFEGQLSCKLRQSTIHVRFSVNMLHMRQRSLGFLSVLSKMPMPKLLGVVRDSRKNKVSAAIKSRRRSPVSFFAASLNVDLTVSLKIVFRIPITEVTTAHVRFFVFYSSKRTGVIFNCKPLSGQFSVLFD